MSQQQLIEAKPNPAIYRQPLTPEEMQKAREIIADAHELVDTPLYKVFPILKPFARIFTKVDEDGENENQKKLLHDEEKGHKDKKKKKKKEVPKEAEAEHDPLNYLGFGMVAYRDLMFTMFVLFGILSVIMLPAMIFYNKQGGITDPKGFAAPFSLGNFGYSSSECQITPFSINAVPVNCPYGSFGKLNSVGVIPSGYEKQTLCHVPQDEEFNKKCPLRSNLHNEVLSYLDTTKQNNKFTFDSIYDIFDSSKTIDATCHDEDAKIFVSYFCYQSTDSISEKRNQAAIISCLGVLLVLVYLTVIHYFKRASDLNQMQWDIQTITPGDYTAQLEITEKAYNHFLEHVYHKDKQRKSDISIGESLKTYIKSQLEYILTQKLTEMKAQPGNENLKINEVKIADIVFAFSNARFINLLKARGQHIMYQRYDKMREVEKTISDLKNEAFNELVRPVDAFITFEEEDGHIVAQEFEPHFDFWGNRKKSENKLFLDDELFLVEATEPTNIIWENRHWTAADYAKRGAQVFGIIAFLLCVSFVTIYTCKSYAINNASKYPNVNESEIVNGLLGGDVNKLYNLAKNEITDYEEKNTPLAGFYQTYCKVLTSNAGNPRYDNMDASICKTYYSDKFGELVSNQAVTIGIVAINFILRLFIIKLIIYIGKDTESEQTRLITNGVFVVQFFNTALLLLMVNANLSEQGSFFKIFSRERGLPDFNHQWFNDIGTTLVGAMLFNVYWPVVEFFVFYGMRSTFRFLDRGFSCNAERTKKTTLQLYIELYSGPVFFIHYKYSSILNITFVTMMYGLGMPILFPIASISLLTLYCVEKLMLHYAYREPPMYDESLNKNALSILTYAPLLFLSFGYWMLSSKQLLSNDNLTALHYADEPRTSGHMISSAFSTRYYNSSNVAMPLLVTFWVLLIVTLLRQYIYKALMTLLPFLHIGNFEIDEDLDNYFNTIDDEDRNWSIKEEENARAALGLHILDDYSLERFRKTKLGEQHMKGTHCYDILANEQYLDDFQYFSPSLPNRNEYIKDDDEEEGNDAAQSDLVKMILNLAFMSEERAKNFSFDKNSCKGPATGYSGGHAIN